MRKVGCLDGKQKDNRCWLQNPWLGTKVQVRENGRGIPVPAENDNLLFPTRKGIVYEIVKK